MVFARKVLFPKSIDIVFFSPASVFVCVVGKLPPVVSVPAPKHMGVLMKNQIVEIIVKIAWGFFIKNPDRVIIGPFEHPC